MPSTNSRAPRPAAEVWGIETDRDHICPSGAVCRIRDLEFDDIVELGLLDEMDSLGSIVQTEHIDRVQGKKPADRAARKPTKAQQAKINAEKQAEIDAATKALMKDKVQFASLSRMLDKVISVTVLEPVIESPWVPIDPEDLNKGERKLARHERLPDARYSDKVPFADKMSVFEEVFKGVEGLESFREERSEGLAAVADEPGSEDEAE